MPQPPEIDPEKLDFSLFHPLDHRPWEPRCREFYGGPFRHIQLWWEFIASHWLHEKTLCKLGVHHYTEHWRGRDPETGKWLEVGKSCVYCLKELEDWRKLEY